MCGQLYHTTTRVVLWTDPGGYDAYRVERRFAPMDESGGERPRRPVRLQSCNPNRYGMRVKGLSKERDRTDTRGRLGLSHCCRKVVDQFVIHFDARGTSKRCFQILHDVRGLSVHFLLDLDGTIYQTLDLKEGAHHATIANGRSIGIEVANIGAYPLQPRTLDRWYQRDSSGRLRVVDPDANRAGRQTTATVQRPIREEPIVGTIQGQELRQYDFTPEQYDGLRHNCRRRYADSSPGFGAIIHATAPACSSRKRSPDSELARYQGILGHYHVQTNKVDPGPAFQWDRLMESTRKLLRTVRSWSFNVV